MKTNNDRIAAYVSAKTSKFQRTFTIGEGLVPEEISALIPILNATSESFRYQFTTQSTSNRINPALVDIEVVFLPYSPLHHYAHGQTHAKIQAKRNRIAKQLANVVKSLRFIIAVTPVIE